MHGPSRRLYQRLGADYYGPLDDYLPPKPKGMRWRTYNAICDRVEAEARGLNSNLLRVLERLTGVS
jgi:hypothetical protein